MVTDGILTNVLNENTWDSTKLSRHSENAVESEMVLRSQVCVQAAMKDEYKIRNKNGWVLELARRLARQFECKLLEHKNRNKTKYYYICNSYEMFPPP